MTAKTNAERQAELVKRRKKQGLKQYRNLWGLPEHEAKVKAYVARLNKKGGVE